MNINNDKCKVKGCILNNERRGYCQSHYYRYNTYGDTNFSLNIKNNEVCKVSDCNNKCYAKNYCKKHYVRWMRTGDINTIKEMHHTRCRVKYCRNKHSAKGFCQIHYKRWKRNGDPLKTIRKTYAGKKLK